MGYDILVERPKTSARDPNGEKKPAREFLKSFLLLEAFGLRSRKKETGRKVSSELSKGPSNSSDAIVSLETDK
jgi:hypothetical protein